jgi:beta-glucosidase
VIVKNTGRVAGKEIAQVYVTAPKGQLDKPAKELKTFGKTRELKPGESETLRMTLQRRDLASFDEAQSAWVVDGGTYLFKIGANVSDIRATAQLNVKPLVEKTSEALALKR